MNELTLAGIAGLIASVLTEVLNRLTPDHKFPAPVLQAVALTLAALVVVGYKVTTSGVAGVDWNATIPAVVGAWAAALAAHDVASPRKS